MDSLVWIVMIGCVVAIVAILYFSQNRVFERNAPKWYRESVSAVDWKVETTDIPITAIGASQETVALVSGPRAPSRKINLIVPTFSRELTDGRLLVVTRTKNNRTVYAYDGGGIGNIGYDPRVTISDITQGLGEQEQYAVHLLKKLCHEYHIADFGPI